MKKFMILMIMMVVLLLLPNTIAEEGPQIYVNSGHENRTALTGESVLVIVNSDKVPEGPNGTLVNSNHTIHLTLSRADFKIYNLTTNLSSGYFTFTFSVDPLWGEFLMHVEVEDKQLRSKDSLYIRIRWSTEYAIWLVASGQLEWNKDLSDDVGKKADTAVNIALGMGGMVALMLPIGLLRLDHITAHRLNQDSLYDRFRHRVWNYSINPAIYYYSIDKMYEHSKTGRKAFQAAGLTAQKQDLDAHTERMQKLSKDLEGEIDILVPEGLGVNLSDQLTKIAREKYEEGRKSQ